jgi:hypothetical protein
MDPRRTSSSAACARESDSDATSSLAHRRSADAACTRRRVDAARRGGAATFAVTRTAGRIDPPRLDVPAKTRVKLTLRNAGGGAAEFEGRDVRVEKVLAPGAESFVVLPPLAPGTYRFFDDFHPDAPGVLIVVK